MCHFLGLTILIQQILLIAPVLMNEKKHNLLKLEGVGGNFSFFFFFPSAGDFEGFP